MKQGLFIVFEGPDGSGKTTGIEVFVNELNASTFLAGSGVDVVRTREPGGTPLAERIRAMVLSEPSLPLSELLLFSAARNEHMQTVILPQKNKGNIVVCDRFADSTFAYQGAGRGLRAEVELLEKLVCGAVKPDIRIFFNLPFDIAQERLAARSGKSDILDNEASDFKQRVYAGYYERMLQNTSVKTYVVDAGKSIEDVAEQLRKIAHEIIAIVIRDKPAVAEQTAVPTPTP